MKTKTGGKEVLRKSDKTMHIIYKLFKSCTFIQKIRRFNIIILSLHYQE